jgi:ketosteroid isomerase-like protein
MFRTHEEKLTTFLKAYEAKHLNSIEGMLAEDIILRDWNLEVQGKEAALSEFAKNFDAAQSLKIEISRIYTTTSAAAAQLVILVNGTETLSVVDVLEFNEADEISLIISYKGL